MYELTVEEQIEYEVVNGKLKFVYPDCATKPDVSGFVPEEIVQKGKKAVRKYALKRIKKFIEKEDKMRDKAIAKMKRTNIVIGDGKVQGRIVDNSKEDVGSIIIKLEKPKKYHNQTFITMCFGLAMSGHQIWDENGNLTDWALEKAKGKLWEMYEEGLKKSKNVKAYNIAKTLNKER